MRFLRCPRDAHRHHSRTSVRTRTAQWASPELARASAEGLPLGGTSRAQRRSSSTCERRELPDRYSLRSVEQYIVDVPRMGHTTISHAHICRPQRFGGNVSGAQNGSHALGSFRLSHAQTVCATFGNRRSPPGELFFALRLTRVGECGIMLSPSANVAGGVWKWRGHLDVGCST